MQEYTVYVVNDMGHLSLSDIFSLPDSVVTFALEKIKNKLLISTDNKNMGCRFYILMPGLNNRWTYLLGDKLVTIDYSHLDKYNPREMTVPSELIKNKE